jgi:hypothetical protein
MADEIGHDRGIDGGAGKGPIAPGAWAKTPIGNRTTMPTNGIMFRM